MRQFTTRHVRLALPAAALALAMSAVPALAVTPAGAGGWRVVATFARAKEFVGLDSVVALSARDAWPAGIRPGCGRALGRPRLAAGIAAELGASGASRRCPGCRIVCHRRLALQR